MTYAQQSFQAGEVLPAAKMNQIEENIRAHYHGRNGVLSIFDSSLTSASLSLTGGDAGRTAFVVAPAARTITLDVNSIQVGWYAAVFNVGSYDAIVNVSPNSGYIDGRTSVPISPQQGMLVVANSGVNGTIGFSTIGRPSGIIPQNAQNANYTIALADAGGHIYHNIASNHLYTIPANSGTGSVSFPIGTAISFVNANSAGNAYIICSADTLRLIGTTDTGTRTLAANGMASVLKVSSSTWVINGTGLT